MPVGIVDFNDTREMEEYLTIEQIDKYIQKLNEVKQIKQEKSKDMKLYYVTIHRESSYEIEALNEKDALAEAYENFEASDPGYSYIIEEVTED